METHDSTKPDFTINSGMQVKTLKHDFLEKFGLGIRVYKRYGRQFADDEVTLAAIRNDEFKGAEFSPDSNSKISTIQDKIMELFGFKVEMCGSVYHYLCRSELTLLEAKEADNKYILEKESKLNKAVINDEISPPIHKLYRITSLEKKSVVFRIEVSDETNRSFAVEEHYRWGQGFREINDPVLDSDITKLKKVRCINGIGWGAEWDDLVMVDFDWGDSATNKFSEKEKKSIKAYWEKNKKDDQGRSGHYWLLEGDHNWHTNPLAPNGFVEIYAPVKIDIVDAGNCVALEENIAPNK